MSLTMKLCKTTDKVLKTCTFTWSVNNVLFALILSFVFGLGAGHCCVSFFPTQDRGMNPADDLLLSRTCWKAMLERPFCLLKHGAKVKWYMTRFFPIVGLNATSQRWCCEVNNCGKSIYSSLTCEILSRGLPRNCFGAAMVKMWLSEKFMEPA